MKKPKKINVDSRQFLKEAANLALSCVTIKQCKDCFHPVLDGYVCGFCGSESPTDRNSEDLYLQV